MPGARRTRSLAWKAKITRVSHHRYTPVPPAFPHANGFNGFLRARLGDRALLSPSPPGSVSFFDRLISASGYQAHTTSPSAKCRSSFRHNRVHRIPHPTFVTIAIRPSFKGAGRRRLWI